MRLRTKLGLAFALVAALPLLALTIPARHALSEAYETSVSARLDFASRAGALALADLSREASRAAEDLSRGEPVEQLAQSLHDGDDDPALTLALARRLMVSRGIDVLELLDSSGHILSSGHLPARAGDPDPAGLALARAGGAPSLIEVEVSTDAGIQRVLATVAARTVDVGTTRIYLLAGQRLGDAFAQHLSALTGAEVALSGREGELARSSPALTSARLRERTLPLPPDPSGQSAGTLRLRLSAEGLYAAEAHLLRSTALLALIALGLAALLGWLLALRITRPVDALAEGAQALARGDLSHRVQARGHGEVGELVQTFNAMARDLQSATQRAALAERIAAWQEVARRLAHEIKNPLTPIRMSVETLQQALARHHPDFEALFNEGSKAIVEEVDRLKRIVDEFSRFARLPPPQLAPVDLAELLGQVLALYAGSAMEIVRALGPVAPVRADRDQLTQVLVNLLQNAEQAMPGGGACTVRLGAVDGMARVEIADTGPGIDEAQRAKVFEPYFTTKDGGSGLGLAIVQRIVAEHGGRVEVVEAPDGGACFRLELPIA